MAENVIIPDEMDFETPPVLPVSRTYQRTFTPEGGSVYKEFQTIEFKIPPSPACYLGKTTYLSFDVHAKYVPGAGTTQWDAGQTYDGLDHQYGTDGSENNEFNAELNTAVLAFEKCGALGCIDRIQVYDYSGVNLLEDTSGHGQLMCLLRDLNTNAFESQYANSYTGTSKVYSSHQWLPVSQSELYSQVHMGNVINEGNTGALFLHPQTAFKDNNVTRIPFCTEVYMVKSVVVPLFSFLGVLSEQMVPLHNGFTIKFLVNSNLNAYTFTNPIGSTSGIVKNNVNYYEVPEGNVNASITSIDYRNLQLVCDVFQLSPTAEQLLRSSRESDEMIVHTKSYRNSNFFLNPNATEFSMTLNGNMKSVRNLIWFARSMYNKTLPVGSLISGATVVGNYYKFDGNQYISKNIVRADTSYPRLSHRLRNSINKWWLKIDHEILPSEKCIECGPNSEDVISYYPKQYYNASGVTTSSTKQTSIVDRSCQSLYHLFNTQDKRNSILHSLIRESNYKIDNSLPVAYPYDEINWMTWYNPSWPVVSTPDSQSKLIDVNQRGIQNVGKFASGLNLQSRPYSSVNTMSGTDFSNKVVRLEGQIKRDDANSASRSAVILDAYLEHDAFIHIIPGVLTTVAF